MSIGNPDYTKVPKNLHNTIEFDNSAVNVESVLEVDDKERTKTDKPLVTQAAPVQTLHSPFEQGSIQLYPPVAE